MIAMAVAAWTLCGLAGAFLCLNYSRKKFGPLLWWEWLFAALYVAPLGPIGLIGACIAIAIHEP